MARGVLGGCTREQGVRMATARGPEPSFSLFFFFDRRLLFSRIFRCFVFSRRGGGTTGGVSVAVNRLQTEPPRGNFS